MIDSGQSPTLDLTTHLSFYQKEFQTNLLLNYTQQIPKNVFFFTKGGLNDGNNHLVLLFCASIKAGQRHTSCLTKIWAIHHSLPCWPF
jgi:hypothetical protein